jgi:hypothetical protein
MCTYAHMEANRSTTMESEAKIITSCPEPRADARTLTTAWSPDPPISADRMRELQEAAVLKHSLDKLAVQMYGNPALLPSASEPEPVQSAKQIRPKLKKSAVFTERERAILSIDEKLPMPDYCPQIDVVFRQNGLSALPERWPRRARSYAEAWESKDEQLKNLIGCERRNAWRKLKKSFADPVNTIDPLF